MGAISLGNNRAPHAHHSGAAARVYSLRQTMHVMDKTTLRVARKDTSRAREVERIYNEPGTALDARCNEARYGCSKGAAAGKGQGMESGGT